MKFSKIAIAVICVSFSGVIFAHDFYADVLSSNISETISISPGSDTTPYDLSTTTTGVPTHIKMHFN